MANDDWDSVSTDAPPTTDPWDAVSIPQPQRPKVRQSVKLTLSRRFVLLALAGLLIVAAASGTAFTIYRVSAIHTATEKAVVTVSAEQIYNQATSGTPALYDPLSDNSNNWDVFTTNWGGQCAFTAGAYHVSLSKPGYGLNCANGSIEVLKNYTNFALQVQINIIQGNIGGVYFGNASYGSYGVDISSDGVYQLNQYVRSSNQIYTLQDSPSSVIKSGLNQINVITFIVNNKNLYFYANGELVTTANLSSYNQGDGGFDAHSNDQPTDVAFSNLKIWTL